MIYIKIYYWILVVPVLVGFFEVAQGWVIDGKVSIFDIISNISVVIFFIGVTGYVWKKTILNELFWRAFFWVNIAVSFLSLYVSQGVVTVHGVSVPSMGWIIGTIFTIPAIIFLYFYAFKSPEIWKGKNSAP